MHLTSFTDYCLRTLMYVGAKGDEGDALVTIDEIADSYRISRNHLMKVVVKLSRLGYLETVRGKGGGVCLAQRPEQINLGTLVRLTEGNLALVECFQGVDEMCCIQSACVLKKALKEALIAFLTVLDGYTLADLLKPRKQLAHLLRIPAYRKRNRA